MNRSLCNIFSLALLLSSTALAGDDPLFKIKDGDKWGFINRSGDVVIKPEYDDCYYQFREGLAAVKLNGKWGYIDSENRMRIAARFDGAQSFKGGMAAVHVGRPFEGEGKWGYIDMSGQYLFEPTDALSYSGFSDGLMPVRKGDKWGYLNTKGEWAIPSGFSDANDFSEGLAGVQAAESTAGFIDLNGNWVIRLDDAVPQYLGFAEGLAAVRDNQTGKIGYIDKNGVWKIPPTFSDGKEFSQGRAAVQILSKDETGWPVRQWGVINRKGELIAQAKYDTVWSYKEGFANVVHDGKWGFLDLEGNLAIPWDGGFSGGGGSTTFFPDNTNLLKRLHATSYRDGERFTCGCCFAGINGRLDPDVLNVGRARGTVTVWIRGFYRTSGKHFSESVDLPIELVEQADGQQDGADHPATTPDSKPDSDEKPQPDSEGRSR